MVWWLIVILSLQVFSEMKQKKVKQWPEDHQCKISILKLNVVGGFVQLSSK